MTTEYSIQKMVSDGTLSTIALGIQYLQRNDIYMRIAGEETPQSGAPSGYTWSFVNNTTLKILPVVPNGVEVVVYRRTDIDAMYNIYSQNAQFDEATIDENNQQLLYIAQEYLEQGIPGAGVDILEFVRDDGTYTYYRIKRTDGSYSDEFAVPSASSSTKVLAREALRRSYAEAGYNLVDGSFEAGGTLVNANDVLLQERTGKGFSGPAGTVAAGTVPSGPNYINRGDETLRSDLAAPDSTVSVGGVEAGQLAIYSDLVKETFITPELFGAVGNGVTVDALAIKQWLESPLKKVARRGAVYNLGLLSGDSALAETTNINHDIDFNFANFVVSGATDGVYTATTMLKVTNGKLAVRNLAGFNDLNFASRGAGRGVVPWIIVNDGVSTEGYSLENIVLDNCQSFGTFVSSNPDNQAMGINIGAGCVIKGNCERGITLSDSGSNIKGVFTINGTVRRDIFASNVSDVDLLIYGGIAQPSSGNILIVAGAGRTVSGINLTLKNEQIYSASIIAGGSDSVLKDINIDIWSETIGDPETEVIRLGAQDGSGNWLTTSNFSSSNVSLKIRSNTKQFLEFGMQSRSPNVEPVKLDLYGNYTGYKQGVGTYLDLNGMSYFADSLSSNAVPISFNTNKIQKNISNIGYEVYVKASGGGAQQDAKYLVTAFKNSYGDLVAFNSSLIYALNVGGVSSAISSSGPNINVTFSGFSGAVNAMVAVKRLEF